MIEQLADLAARRLDTPLVLAEMPIPIVRPRPRQGWPRRQADRTAGRRALRAALEKTDSTMSLSRVEFPSAFCSISHGGGVAIAAHTIRPVAGIGIDYEPVRAVKLTVCRWFLRPEELRAMSGTHPICAERIVQLWTVKEAAFKSCPDNSQLVLTDLRIVSALDGIFRVACAGQSIAVFSTAYGTGYVAVAINRGRT